MTTPHPQADLLRAIADGKQMQELDFPGINHPGNWCDCDADRALNRISRGVEQCVRIKPDTVTINGIECNAPAAGARPSITPTERVTIHTLISLARLTYLALDDSEEFVDDYGRCHRISGQAFDDVEATLETLDELPDDKPGVTLSPGGKAWWALRGLLNPVAQAAPPTGSTSI